MRIARVEIDGAARAAIVSADASSAALLAPAVSVADLLSADPDQREKMASGTVDQIALAEARLLAPVQPPTVRDFSVFEQHIEGVRMGQTDEPVPAVWYESLFCYFSNPHAVNGPGAEIAVPPGCVDLDFELEVAAVIGRPGSNLRPDDAAAHIAGYTIFNDWSARDLQLAEMRLGLGICKGKDFANTLGPWIVTADELEGRREGDRLDLDMRATVNGREIGDDTLANMAWSFEELVSYASRGTTVRTGDVLGSGTCGGGCLLEMWGRHGREDYPPLGPGDTVALTVEGIGTLSNTVVAGPDPIALPPARPGRLRSRATA
ncbi:MAG TPA: fumarylacetoacetate hydrolase family protein [Solirubrobacteraceae bacterium]|nr:fumarylacetoacetate hydrolase family protein [Solirubrobacteraceae bacterium]